MRTIYPKPTHSLGAAFHASRAICCAVFILIACLGARAQASDSVKNVLVLYDEHTAMPGLAMVDKSIKSTFGAADASIHVAVYSESMDLSRFQRPGYDEFLRDVYKQKYREKKIDVVIAVFGTSLNFALAHIDEIAPGAPIVFCGIDPNEIAGRDLGKNVNGVLLKRDFKGTLDVALKLHPSTRQVVFVGGTGAFDRYIVNSATEQLKEFENRVKITYLTDLPLNETLQRVAHLSPDTLVLYGTVFKDGAGESFVPHEVCARVSEAANVPVYGFLDQYVGTGIVGGHVYSVEAQGTKAAEIVLKILRGESVPNIPITDGATNVDMFDARQLKRWGISKDDLPVGSVVQFDEPTLWESYKWYIVGATAAILIETLLVAGFIFMRLRRRQAQAEAARLSEQIAEIVANVPGIVWETRTDPVTNQRMMTFLSDYVEQMLGYTPEEWLKQPAGFGLQLVVEEDRERVKSDGDYVEKTGKGAVSEFRWRTKDGRIRWVENYLNPLFDRNSRVVGLRGVALDVTHRKQAEEQARQVEEKDKAILTAIPDLMFLQSLDGDFLDYHATDPNDLLVPPEVFLGKNVRDVLPSDVAERFLTCFERAEEGGGPQILEYALEVSGEESWYEARMVRTGDKILSVVRDITERKRAEAEVVFQSRMLNAVEQAAIAVYLDGTVFYWNRFSEELYGWSADEAVGREVRELLVSEQRLDDVAEIWAHLQRGQNWVGEFSVKHRDGTIIQIWVNDSPIYNDKGEVVGILSITHDITERKAAEEALQASEHRLRMAQQAARVGTWEWDIATGSSVWSEMIWELLGLVPGDSEPTLERFVEFIHPEDRERAMKKVNEVMAEGEEYYDEFRVIRGDGSVLWLASKGAIIRSADGQPERMLGVNIDITERKAADESLREREERFRNMAETAPVMIWMTDENQATTYVNRQWLELTGSTMEEESGLSWTKHLHPDDVGRTIEQGTAAFQERVPFELEFRILRPDAECRWVLSSGTPRFSSDGKFRGYIGTAFDITDRKESERELQAADDELNKLKNQLEAENIYLQEELRQDQAFGDIVGQSSGISYVMYKISQVAPIDSTVLIMGETGTGKELVARAIHEGSKRTDRPLIKVNCAALSPSLIESELFGHEKGAFSGAAGRKLGRFELANTGTLLLDEIGDLPLDLQSKLLRVIQEGEFERVGSGTTIKTDVRIIALTNRDLRLEVEQGRFREDLWYRLNVFPITTPPLRDRRDDIPILTEHFARTLGRKFGKEVTAVSPDTMKALCAYSWPGNVRELANVIERAIINLRGTVLTIQDEFSVGESEMLMASVKTLEEMERDYIVRILEDMHWRIDGPRGAARILDVNPSTLRTRMAKLGIQKPNGKEL